MFHYRRRDVGMRHAGWKIALLQRSAADDKRDGSFQAGLAAMPAGRSVAVVGSDNDLPILVLEIGATGNCIQ